MKMKILLLFAVASLAGCATGDPTSFYDIPIPDWAMDLEVSPAEEGAK